MTSSIKPSSSSSSRYNNSPSSSSDTLFHNHPISNSSSSKAIIKTRTATPTNANNFSSMVKKFMETRSGSAHSYRKPQKGLANKPLKLTVAADFLAEDLKKTGLSGTKKATPLGALHKKLFKGGKKENEERKALSEVKGNNTRTLAMVLRSERELLNLTKEQESQISELKLLLEDKNREVEKLKDLCLKQREEIQSLKSAVLFPDTMNSQLQDLLEKQGSELKQAKLLIPNLQKQVSSLTGQLQCLADDLAEVKALRGCSFDNYSSPRTPPTYEQDEATNSLEFSSGDQTTPGSPDDLFTKDLNPCLTPYYTTKSKGFEERNFLDDDEVFGGNTRGQHHFGYDSCSRKLSKSSDCRQCPSSASNGSSVHANRRSDESKFNYARQMRHRHF